MKPEKVAYPGSFPDADYYDTSDDLDEYTHDDPIEVLYNHVGDWGIEEQGVSVYCFAIDGEKNGEGLYPLECTHEVTLTAEQLTELAKREFPELLE